MEMLTTGLIHGQYPSKLAEEFAKKMNTKKFDAYRLLHTETSYLINEATHALYKANGVEKYQILATLDSKICAICGEKDEEIYKLSDGIVGSTKPPFHPLCRCTDMSYYDDDDIKDMERVARDKNCEYFKVPADMSYEEWKKRFVSGGDKSGLSSAKEDDKIKSIKNEHLKVFVEKLESMPVVEPVKSPLEDREYKTLTLEELKRMTGKCTREERKIIYGRSRGGYIASGEGKKINKDLRNGQTLNSHMQKVTETLRAVIDKNIVDDDTMVYRYVGVHAFQDMTGVAFPETTLRTTKEEFWDMVSKIPEQVKSGHMYVEKAFFSTSGVLGKNVFDKRHILVNIKVPKGTHGYVTTNYRESEIIFDRPKIRIIDVEVNQAKNGIIVNCILEE